MSDASAPALEHPWSDWNNSLFQFLASTNEDETVANWFLHCLDECAERAARAPLRWIDMGSGNGAKVANVLRGSRVRICDLLLVEPWPAMGPWLVTVVDRARERGIRAVWLPFDLDYATALLRCQGRLSKPSVGTCASVLSSFHVCYDDTSFATFCAAVASSSYDFLAYVVEGPDSSLAIARRRIAQALGLRIPAAGQLETDFLERHGYESRSVHVSKDIWVPPSGDARRLPSWLFSMVLGATTQQVRADPLRYAQAEALLQQVADPMGTGTLDGDDWCTFAWRRK